MNRLEMIHKDGRIEIYFKCNLLSHEYYISSGNKILARYYCIGSSLSYMDVLVQTVRFKDLELFHKVVTEHITKAL